MNTFSPNSHSRISKERKLWATTSIILLFPRETEGSRDMMERFQPFRSFKRIDKYKSFCYLRVFLPPVMFLQVCVCSRGGGGLPRSGFCPRREGGTYSILPGRGAPFPIGSTPILPDWVPHPRLDRGYPPGPDWMGVLSSFRQEDFLVLS